MGNSIKKTPRGFEIYTTIKDSYGQEVRVQKSSSGEENAVWIFCHANPLSNVKDPAPHLTRPQANKIIEALRMFVNERTCRYSQCRRTFYPKTPRRLYCADLCRVLDHKKTPKQWREYMREYRKKKREQK